jgi:hypothetical protein
MRAVVLALLSAGCGRVDFAHTAFADAAADGAHDATTDAAPDAPPDALGIDAPPPMPPVFIQHETGFSSGSTTVAGTFDDAVAAGNLVIAAFDYGQSGADPMSSVTDTLGTTLTVIGPYDGGGGRLYIAYGLASVAGSDTITVTLQQPATNYFELRLHEFTNASLPLDGFSGSAGVSTATDGCLAGSITTTHANDVLFAMMVDGTVTAGTGYTTLANDFGDLTEDQLAVTPGAYNMAGTATGDWTAMAIAIPGR